jgi:hypothetical protein
MMWVSAMCVPSHTLFQNSGFFTGRAHNHVVGGLPGEPMKWKQHVAMVGFRLTHEQTTCCNGWLQHEPDVASMQRHCVMFCPPAAFFLVAGPNAASCKDGRTDVGAGGLGLHGNHWVCIGLE